MIIKFIHLNFLLFNLVKIQIIKSNLQFAYKSFYIMSDHSHSDDENYDPEAEVDGNW